MNIDVKLDKEAITAQIVGAILESAIGEKIEKGINAALTNKGYGRDSIVDEAIKSAVFDTIRGQVSAALRDNDVFKERVKAAVEEKATDVVLRGIVTKLFEKCCEDGL